MRDEEFKIYDPFRRQRKKRTGVASDFTKMYQDHVDKPMVARIVEAGRRTDRRNGEWDEERIERRAEYMDAQIRSDAANATRGDTPFAPRDFAAKYGIDLAELGRNENKRPALWWAPLGSEERQYQESNNALGKKDYEDLMAIPERRAVPRNIDNGFGQPEADIVAGDLGPGAGGGLFPKEPEKELSEDELVRFQPMPIRGPGGDDKVRPLPRVISDPRQGGTKDSPEGEFDTDPFPERITFPVQPRDGSGNNPVSRDPVFEPPYDDRTFPFPQPVTNSGTDAAAPSPEIPPGFGQTFDPETQQMIDELFDAIANGQITSEAAKALIAPDGMSKFSVQNTDAFASAEEASFTGEGANQFAVQNMDPRAGANALRPDPAEPDSPLQPDEEGEEEKSRGDLYKTLAGPRGYHVSPYGTDYNKEPDYDLEGWDGTEWQDDLPFFEDNKYHKLSSRYGWRYKNKNKPKDFHSGIDVTADAHTTVKNVTKGVIAHIYRGRNGLYGVVIKGDDGYFYTYYHMNAGIDLAVNQKVDVGTPLGTIEDQGRKSHLHHSKHDPESGDWRDIGDENSLNPLG